MEFKVNTELVQNMLTATIESEYDLREIYCTLLLKKDGKIIDRFEGKGATESKFKLIDYGQYWVQGIINFDKKNYWKNSSFIFYVINFLNEYTNFCKQKEEVVEMNLELYKSNYPYQDYCAFFVNKNVFDLKRINTLEKKYSFSKVIFSLSLHKKCVIFSSRKIKKYRKYKYLFSGVTRNKNKLLIGDNDFDVNKINPDTVNDEIGDYYLIYNKNRKIYFKHDYLGLEKTYYYQDEDLFICSNRYHLLLIALNYIQIKPEIDTERAISDLSTITAFARLNYGRNMIYKKTYVMPIDKQVVLSKNGVVFQDTELHHELCNPNDYCEEEYNKLLRIAKNEIIDNVRISFEHENFINYQLDLSGGIDTRIVYAAISNIEEFYDKTSVNISDLSNYPLDLPIALKINSLFKFRYDTIPTKNIKITYEEYYKQMMSFYLGINQQPRPQNCIFSEYKTLKLPGFLGELVSRPHMYTKFKGSPSEDNLTIQDFVDKRYYFDIESISREGKKYLKRYFLRSLKRCLEILLCKNCRITIYFIWKRYIIALVFKHQYQVLLFGCHYYQKHYFI